jgi:hypothetical protein
MAPGTAVVRLSADQVALLRHALRIDAANPAHPARGSVRELQTLFDRTEAVDVRIRVSPAGQLPPRHVRGAGRS